MQKLHLVGFTTDQRGLILSTRRGTRSGSFHVTVDDELAEAVEELRAKQAEAAAAAEAEAEAARPTRVESALSVKEIQARLRQGRAVADVAKAAGVEPEWVERFAPPVFAERARVIAAVQGRPLRRTRLGPSELPIAESLRRNLAERGVSITPEEFNEGWSARQLADGRWAVRFRYRHRNKDHVLRYDLDEAAGTLVAADRSSGLLGYVTPTERPAPKPKRPDVQPTAAVPTERPAKRATVTVGFRPDRKKATSPTARERERANEAMRRAAAQRAAEAEKAAARRARERAEREARLERERQAAEAKRLREEQAAEARRQREIEAKERAKAAEARKKAAAAKKLADQRAREKAAKERKKAAAAKKRAADRAKAKAAKQRADQARRAEAALRAAERRTAAAAKKTAKQTPPTTKAAPSAKKKAVASSTKKAAGPSATKTAAPNAKKKPVASRAASPEARPAAPTSAAARARAAAAVKRAAAVPRPQPAPEVRPPVAAPVAAAPVATARPAPPPVAIAPSLDEPTGDVRILGPAGGEREPTPSGPAPAQFRPGLAQPTRPDRLDRERPPLVDVRAVPGNGRAPERPPGARRTRPLRAT